MTGFSTGAIVLLNGGISAERVMSFTRERCPSEALSALMVGIRANPLWGAMPGAQLAGRVDPTVMLAAFGHFDEFQLDRLSELATHLREVLTCHRYIDYASAERATEQLAHQLLTQLGQERLSGARFAAIPRGGWIVLGMLSYFLDLRPEQLIAIDAATLPVENELLIVVDDCALSGVRFQQVLNQLDHPRVVFCPLFAVPDLCRNIEREESRVERCFNAEDLSDIGHERYGDDYPVWRAKRKRLLAGHGYWIGITEYVAFAWCEPQTRYWNEHCQRFEAGWNLLPPTLSIKRRVAAKALGREQVEVGDQTSGLQCNGPGPLLAVDRLLWVYREGLVALALVPADGSTTTPCFCLEGVAADMWRYLVECGELEAAHARLVDQYDVDPDRLFADMQGILQQLSANHLIVMRDTP